MIGLSSASNAQQVVTYTTTADGGQRMEKKVYTTTKSESGNIITLFPGRRNQSIDGFGFAMTYSTCYNLMNRMSKSHRQALLKKTFSKTIGYGASYVRISIGCCDFSSRQYTLCDEKGPNNNLLEKFSLQSDERDYVIPVLKEIVAINPQVKIIATPWTSPKWMKVNDINSKSAHDSWTDGHLNPDYYGVYAEYFVKFINAMKANGLHIHAVTPQNEPLNRYNCASLYMPWQEEANFVRQLASTFKRNNISAKIYLFDHNFNYDNIGDQNDYPIKIYNALGSDFEGSELVAGSAYHNYGGDSGELSDIHNQRNDKEVIFTETTIGDWNEGSNLGKRLVDDMKYVVLGSVNKWCRAVIVWNFMLDKDRGPHLGALGGCNNAFGAIDVNDDGTLRYNSHYYDICHISSVVRPGAYRIDTEGWWAENMDYAAFRNQDGTLAILFASDNNAQQNFFVTDGNEYAKVTVPPHSVVSVAFGNLKETAAQIEYEKDYDLIQNKIYTISTELKCHDRVDPDFFGHSEGSSRYRFLAVSGRYKITVDKGMLTAIASNAGVYASGAPRTFNRSGMWESWGWPLPTNLAQVEKGVYRMTLTTGDNLNAKELNFKFFNSGTWGEFDADRITLKGLAASKLDFEVQNGKRTGNLFYKSGASLEANTTYIFTVTPNTTNNSYTLDIQKQTDMTNGIDIYKNDTDDKPQPIYDITGRMVGYSMSTLPAGIYIKGGRKYVVR